MSDSTDFQVVFEPFVGGRILEVAPDGTEFVWGEVTEWEPPALVEYRWHIFFDPDKSTRVSVTFTESEHGAVVRLENSGFDVFGAPTGEERRGRVGDAWSRILEAYREAL